VIKKPSVAELMAHPVLCHSCEACFLGSLRDHLSLSWQFSSFETGFDPGVAREAVPVGSHAQEHQSWKVK
jgi:hypothetical protein